MSPNLQSGPVNVALRDQVAGTLCTCLRRLNRAARHGRPADNALSRRYFRAVILLEVAIFSVAVPPALIEAGNPAEASPAASSAQDANANSATSGGHRCAVPRTGQAPSPKVMAACYGMKSRGDCLAYSSPEFPYHCVWTSPPGGHSAQYP
jgi:hypothetical protein